MAVSFKDSSFCVCPGKAEKGAEGLNKGLGFVSRLVKPRAHE